MPFIIAECADSGSRSLMRFARRFHYKEIVVCVFKVMGVQIRRVNKIVEDNGKELAIMLCVVL